MSSDSTSLQSNCSLHFGPGLHEKTDDSWENNCTGRLNSFPTSRHKPVKFACWKESYHAKRGRNDHSTLSVVAIEELQPIEALHVTYHAVNMADCSNPFKRCEDTTYRLSVSYTITNALSSNRLIISILLNRLHMAMITVLDIGSSLLFGVNQ